MVPFVFMMSFDLNLKVYQWGNSINKNSYHKAVLQIIPLVIMKIAMLVNLIYFVLEDSYLF